MLASDFDVVGERHGVSPEVLMFERIQQLRSAPQPQKLAMVEPGSQPLLEDAYPSSPASTIPPSPDAIKRVLEGKDTSTEEPPKRPTTFALPWYLRDIGCPRPTKRPCITISSPSSLSPSMLGGHAQKRRLPGTRGLGNMWQERIVWGPWKQTRVTQYRSMLTYHSR